MVLQTNIKIVPLGRKREISFENAMSFFVPKFISIIFYDVVKEEKRRNKINSEKLIVDKKASSSKDPETSSLKLTRAQSSQKSFYNASSEL